MSVTYQIHPAIGIARIGNSRSEHFIGPEAPGNHPLPNGPFKDESGFIKRQGARFRVYAYTFDDFGTLDDVREITADDAVIEWQVHMVNKKAAAEKFPNGTSLRNAGITGDIERRDLVINPGSMTVSGKDQSSHLVGSFLNTEVELGDLLTDEAGRLIVLGGFGTSRSVPTGQPIVSFANNDGWCDDTADGPVMATVQVNGGDVVAAEPAWVVVAPPDFAPPIENIVTLYDIVFQEAIRLDPRLAISQDERMSFTRDIYPILMRAANLRWVSKKAREGHGESGVLDFLSDQRLAGLSANDTSNQATRERVFRRLRPPVGDTVQSSFFQNMPFLGYEPTGPTEPLELTRFQYEKMRVWSQGDFEADWDGPPAATSDFAQIAESDRPAALDRAALEACVGGPFFPGIEAGSIMAESETYDSPFRISASRSAGDLTAGLAVPWQADFDLCSHLWWPGQRPNVVRRGDEWVDWVPSSDDFKMIRDWFRLGFVVNQGSAFVEDERDVDED